MASLTLLTNMVHLNNHAMNDSKGLMFISRAVVVITDALVREVTAGTLGIAFITAVGAEVESNLMRSAIFTISMAGHP